MGLRHVGEMPGPTLVKVGAMNRHMTVSSPRRGRPRMPVRLLVQLGVVCSLLAAGLLAPTLAQASSPVPAPPTAGPGYERSISPTPYLGWNTYYGIGAFNETTIRAAADQLSTMRNLGYKYVWLDGGWWQGLRNPDGTIKVDPAQWPSGMKAVADYIHAKGLKAGIYTDIGSSGCGGAAQGSYGHYQQDANTFAGWGYDALKVDWCGGALRHWNEQDAQRQYTQFSQALRGNSSHRPMLYNICIWQNTISQDQYSWAPAVSNSYRVSGDEGTTNGVSWPNLLADIDRAAAHPQATGPGYYADPDYVNVGVPYLSTTEGQAQMSMWSMLSAPLILGTDILHMSAVTKATVSNKQVIAIDQDPLVSMASKVAEPTPGPQVWSKRLAASGQDQGTGRDQPVSERAVALFNRTGAGALISTTAAAVGLPRAHAYVLQDLWQHSNTETAGRISAFVPAHGVALYRVQPARGTPGYPPATTLSSSTAPVYPGSELHLAVPGQHLPVTSTFENDGRAPVTHLTFNFSAPRGWQLQPKSAASGERLGTNAQLAKVWTATPPPGTLPGSYVLTADATYRWGKHRVAHATSQTQVTVPTAPPSGASYLSDRTWLDATSGYNVPQLDREVGGGRLRLQKQTYAKGIGTASPSQIEYYLGGNCTNVSATVGIDDAVRFDPTGGTAVFQVLADGHKLYDSGLVTRDATQHFSVDLTGAKVLTLLVGDAGDGGYNDRADWANLQATCGPPPATVPNGPWPHFVASSSETATASSSNGGYPPGNAIDGKLTTIWHSQFSPVHAPLPISISIDLGAVRTVAGLTYQPRLDGDTTGTITQYTVELSTDGTSYAPATTGAWAPDTTLKSADFPAKTARYVRLTATAGVNGYASAAEIGIAEVPGR